jgi:hypothetical protein
MFAACSGGGDAADDDAPMAAVTACRSRATRFVVWLSMVKTLEQAIVEVASLPDADQEEIGRRLLSHVEKLRRLRDELDKGARSLDAGEGTKFSIEEFIRQKTR